MSEQKNKLGKYTIRDRKKRKRNQDFILEYLKTHYCVDCGEDDPVVLEFDHLRDKEENISDLINQRKSLKRIKAEIAKCEVVCANCHRVRTAKNFGSYKIK